MHGIYIKYLFGRLAQQAIYKEGFMFLLWDYGGACLRAEFKDCRIVFRLNEVLALSFVYCINN